MGEDPRPTSDEDLMDLASRHSYEDLYVSEIDPLKLEINGKIFLVRDRVHDTVTGLDAYTFENQATGELTVAFAGTVGDPMSPDVKADVQLVTAMTPEQFIAAEEYVKSVAANPKLGPVSSVCGNSLGGGMATYVAVCDPSIRAVTVNPAPVPAGMAGADAPNVRNYISTKTDILYRALVAGGMRDRILGEVIKFEGTSLGAAFVLENHAGSEVFKSDLYKSYNGSMGVPFSLFYENTVVGPGGFGARIDVTPESFEFMALALAAQKTDAETALGEKLSAVAGELEEHLASLDQREARTKELFQVTLTLLMMPVYTKIETVRAEVDQFEIALKALNPPGPLQAPWDRAVTVIAEAIDTILVAVDEVIDFGVVATAEVMWDAQAFVFHTGSQEISSELLALNTATSEHVELVKAKWETITTYIGDVNTALSSVDDAVAAAIASGTCLPGVITVTVPDWPAGTVDVLGTSASVDFYQWTIAARDEVVSVLLSTLASQLAVQICTPLSETLGVGIVALEALEDGFGAATSIVRGAIQAAAFNPLAFVTGASDDLWRFQDKIGDLHDDLRRQSDTWQTHLEEARTAIVNLPDALTSLGSNAAQGIFSDSVIENVYNSYAQTRNIVDRAENSFAEIDHQLRGHRATAIDALALRADDVKKDLATTSTNLDDMIG